MTTATNTFQNQVASETRPRLWVGRILSILPALFLLIDGIMKLMRPAVVVEATAKLGYPESTILGIGIVLVACTSLYLIPRTSVLGAILLTGYLGGAIATHVRVGGPVFPIIFPLIIAAMLLGRSLLAQRAAARTSKPVIRTWIQSVPPAVAGGWDRPDWGTHPLPRAVLTVSNMHSQTVISRITIPSTKN